jgi:hypothetical protein
VFSNLELKSAILDFKLRPPFDAFVKTVKDLRMVRPRGFEPLTCGLEIRCSIQLSYGRKQKMLEEDFIALESEFFKQNN